MAITYLSGNRIQGLSTDTVETPTFSDDFTSYTTQGSADASWTHTGTNPQVNITNDNIDFAFASAVTNLAISKDITSISNTLWILRFKVRFSTLTQALNAKMHIGISSLPYTTDDGTTNDYIGIEIKNASGTTNYGGNDADGTGKHTGNPAESLVTLTWATATDYFFEITRTSASAYIIKRYSSSAYTTVLDSSSCVTTSTVSSLRYIVIQNHSNNSIGNFTGTVDDIAFYNGVSSLNSKPTNVPNGSRFEETDTRLIYSLVSSPNVLNDTFTADNWTDVGTKYAVNTTTGVIDWNSSGGNVSHNTVYDLGVYGVSETNWILTYKFTISAVTISTGADISFWGGLSNSNGSVGDRTAQDFTGLLCIVDTANKVFEFRTTDGTSPYGTGGTAIARTVTAETLYVKINRSSATSITLGLYSDSNYTTLLEEKTRTITSGITGLRYIKFMNDSGSAGTDAHTLNGKIDDVKFYNGVSSIPSWWVRQ